MILLKSAFIKKLRSPSINSRPTTTESCRECISPDLDVVSVENGSQTPVTVVVVSNNNPHHQRILSQAQQPVVVYARNQTTLQFIILNTAIDSLNRGRRVCHPIGHGRPTASLLPVFHGSPGER